MKFFILLTLFALVSCSTTQQFSGQRGVSAVTPNIFIIGDSNLVGDFGKELHRSMAEWKEADILSVAIGGANPTYFKGTMKNICCGYRVRASEKNVGTVKEVKALGRKDSAVVLPEYNGDIIAYIKAKKPSMVVITLGSNADSEANYKALVKKIYDHNSSLPIYWVGPPDDAAINATRADARIKAALDQYPRAPYHAFSSQKVAKKIHPGPADAKKWVKGFIDELKGIAR